MIRAFLYFPRPERSTMGTFCSRRPSCFLVCARSARKSSLDRFHFLLFRIRITMCSYSSISIFEIKAIAAAVRTIITIGTTATKICTVIIEIIIVTTFAIEPARMTNPRFYIFFGRNDSVSRDCSERALDRRVGIVTFRRISIALPANAVKFEVRIGQAKADIFMRHIVIVCSKRIQIKGILIFLRIISVIIPRKRTHIQFVICRKRCCHHNHTRCIYRCRIRI